MLDEVKVDVEDEQNLNHTKWSIKIRKLEDGHEILPPGPNLGSTLIKEVNKGQNILHTLYKSLGMSKIRIIELVQKDAVDEIDQTKHDIKYLNAKNLAKCDVWRKQ